MNYFSKVISVLFLISSFYINAQYGGQYVFVDGANVRNAPSLKGKKLGVLKEGSRINRIPRFSMVYDTVGGRKGYWHAIDYKGKTGYIWQHILARFSQKSVVDVSNLFLFNQSVSGALQVKVVKNNQVVYKISFPKDIDEQLVLTKNYGILHNSNRHEIIACKYYYHEKYSYELYEWDGKAFYRSTIKLDDDVFLTGKPEEYGQYYISHHSVNLRSDSTLGSSVIASMPRYSKVEYVRDCKKSFRMGDNYGKWAEVVYEGKKGFVWDYYLSRPFAEYKSNYEKEITYRYASNAIYVLKKGQIVSSAVFPYHHWERESFYQEGSKGLGNELQFVSLYEAGEACGKYSGYHYYVWNGKTIKYFGSSGGAGEAGEDEYSELIFPSGIGTAMDTIIQFNNIEYSHDFGASYTYKEIKWLKYQNDTLVEIPSIHQKLRSLIKIKYPKYELMDYEFFDINRDGYQDVLYYISYSYYSEKVGGISDGIVGIALGNKSGELSIFRENKTLLNEGEGYPRVMLQVNKDSFSISKIYNSYYDSDYVPVCYRFNFLFRKSTNGIIWDSKSIIHMEGDYGQRVPKTKTSYFKKNKILFQDAWDNNSSDE